MKEAVEFLLIAMLCISSLMFGNSLGEKRRELQFFAPHHTGHLKRSICNHDQWKLLVKYENSEVKWVNTGIKCKEK